MPVVALLSLTVAGCTTVSPGEATPASTNQTNSTTDPSSDNGDGLPSNGAPKVEHPLGNLSRFEQDPCSILTAEQATGPGLPATGKEDDGALGLDCEWRNPDTRGSATIGFLTNNPRGLSGAYAARDRGDLKYFAELAPVDGYPAIASDIADRRSQGVCLVTVGVTDQLAFHVDLQQSQANVGTVDPCEIAAKVAGKALQTIKGA